MYVKSTTGFTSSPHTWAIMREDFSGQLYHHDDVNKTTQVIHMLCLLYTMLSVDICLLYTMLSVDIFVDGLVPSPWEFPRAQSKSWRVPPLKYIVNSPILGVHWALRQNFIRAPLDFQGPRALSSGPLSESTDTITSLPPNICIKILENLNSNNNFCAFSLKSLKIFFEIKWH